MKLAPYLVRDLISLQRGYSSIHRATITEERYNLHLNDFNDFAYDAEIFREPLIEHVGHLPIVASYLHSYIEHSDDVDLGRVLTMLSVHDVGETVVGDVLTFVKSKQHSDLELEETKKLLSTQSHKFVEEYEKRETSDARYAKSVDVLAPMLHSLSLPPSIAMGRMRYHGYSVSVVAKEKRKLFLWDNVLVDIFDYVIESYRKMESSL